MRALIHSMRQLLRSHAIKLSLSMVLLVFTAMLAADMLQLRGNPVLEKQQARKTVAEALAVQLSALASRTTLEDLQTALTEFVIRNDDALAASLNRSDGRLLAAHGDRSLLDMSASRSTLQHLVVPIFDGTARWGEVRVAFRPISALRENAPYYLLVIGLSLGLFFVYLYRVLLQLDPGKVVPDRVESAFNLFSDGVVVLDDEYRILLSNTSASRLIEDEHQTEVGRSIEAWPWIRDDNWEAPWRVALETRANVVDRTLMLDVNPPRVVIANCTPVGEQNGAASGVMLTLDDMTAIHEKNRELSSTLAQLRRSQESITRKNRELEVLATSDPLTGLMNRRALMDGLNRIFATTREEHFDLCLLMVDIDHFKQINDTHGHAVGDEVICAVAQILESHCRKTDLVGRFGGEEYLMVLPDADLSHARTVAERIRVQISDFGNSMTSPVNRLSASLGLADYQYDVESVEALIERADQALYVAKESGRNRVVFHGQKITKHAGDAGQSDNTDTASAGSDDLQDLLDEQNRQMQTLKTHDLLTGVPKRQLFEHAVQMEMSKARRFDKTMGVMALDIRDMDMLVNTLGDDRSDYIVKSFIDRIQETVRRSDLVVNISEDHNVSRIRDNQYGILLSDLDNPEQALPVITRIRHLLAAPVEIDGDKVYLGCNIGIAVFPHNGEDAVTLIESANRARLKATGYPEKIAYSFAAQELETRSREYLKLEADLFEAVAAKQFDVFFQPKFDLSSRTISGAEALIRWFHPDRGFVSPADFIPIAEANGLIRDIFTHVLTASCQQLREWESLGITNVNVSVNISAAQLRDRALVETVLTTLEKTGQPSSRLEIELTETSVIRSPQRARIALRQLREAGVQVSMDDFGTGYTSLALLAELPLDSVKIDRSFVSAMENSERSRAIVESIISMAHSLKLWVVGEGVETDEQLDMLDALGCNEIQGFLISRPLPAGEITELLQKELLRSDGQMSARRSA